jgi:hypothetical protein
MRTRTIVATVVAAAALTAGAAGTALAQSDPSTPTPAAEANAKGIRKDFVCAHQDEIKQLLAERKAVVGTSLNLLKEARQTAVDAGATKKVAQIDKRIAKATKVQERVDNRIEKLPAWVSEHCPG